VKQSSVHFPGLNALRFFAAFAVLISHVELVKNNTGIGGDLWVDVQSKFYTLPLLQVFRGEFSWLVPIVSELGSYGVVFFFVLSGFLITYLLYIEKEKTGTIHLRHFYMRRILRIWPLYLLLVFLGFFVLPQIDLFNVGSHSEKLEHNFWQNLLLYVFMVPNVASAIYSHIPNIGQLWSIGVEEQFYVFWPAALKKVISSIKFILIFLVSIILLKAAFVLFTSPFSFVIFKTFLASFKIECMAIGALGAWLLFNQHKLLNLLLSKSSYVISLIFIPISFFLIHPLIQDGFHLLTSVAFLIVILNVASKERGKQILETKFLRTMGKSSYGIYMYHMLFCSLMVNLFSHYLGAVRFNAWQNFLLYFSITVITLVTSYLSYTYFEKPFLKFKTKFQKIKSHA